MDNADDSFALVDSATMEDKPFLDSHVVDMTSKTAGKIYKVKVEAYNQVGAAISTTVPFILASVPGAPPLAEYTSDGDNVVISLEEPSDNGGSIVSKYELQVDFNDGKSFRTIAGGDVEGTTRLSVGEYEIDFSKYLPADQSSTGRIFEARYRAFNNVGWGAWSPISYMYVAGTPSVPDEPYFVSATDDTITI